MTYLYGSFGSGKSYFMAILYLLLHGDANARSIPELAEVIAGCQRAVRRGSQGVPLWILCNRR